MRLIDADKVKIESRKHCINCTLNGTKQCKTCVVNLICDRLDLQPTIEERPQGEWVRKEDLIHYIATQYSKHNELVPVWLSIGDLKGGAYMRSEDNGKK